MIHLPLTFLLVWWLNKVEMLRINLRCEWNGADFSLLTIQSLWNGAEGSSEMTACDILYFLQAENLFVVNTASSTGFPKNINDCYLTAQFWDTYKKTVWIKSMGNVDMISPVWNGSLTEKKRRLSETCYLKKKPVKMWTNSPTSPLTTCKCSSLWWECVETCPPTTAAAAVRIPPRLAAAAAPAQKQAGDERCARTVPTGVKRSRITTALKPARRCLFVCLWVGVAVSRCYFFFVFHK